MFPPLLTLSLTLLCLVRLHVRETRPQRIRYFQASTGQPPCVPRRVISYSPYRMGFTSDDSDSQVAE
jgi:hypothetical protein